MSLDGPYSHSRLECFRKCPLQFRLRYVDEIPSRRQGIEAFMGSRVHEVLEFLYAELMEGRYPELPDLTARYESAWDEHLGDDVRVVREAKTVDDYRALGKDCITRYVHRHAPFADAARTIAVEQLVEFVLDDDERYALRGYVDRVTRGEDDVLEIHDYKTAQRVPPDRYFDDGQLALYQIGLGRVFPEQRGVRLIWHYLVPGTEVVRELDERDLDQRRRRTTRLIDVVRASRTFPAQTSALCRWCEYNEICPTGRRFIEKHPEKTPFVDGLVWRYAQIRRAAAATDEAGLPALRKEANLLKRNIIDYVSRSGLEVLESGDARLVVQSTGDRWSIRLED